MAGPSAAVAAAVRAADAISTGALAGNTAAHSAATLAWTVAGAAASGSGSGEVRPGRHGAYWLVAIRAISPLGVRAEISPRATATYPASCAPGLTATVKSAPPGLWMPIIDSPAMTRTPSRFDAPMRPATKRISPFINSTVELFCARLAGS